jgi:hypothetical protein
MFAFATFEEYQVPLLASKLRKLLMAEEIEEAYA